MNAGRRERKLEGLAVLVTGASQGVGRGIALAAAAAGASVTVTARKLGAAEAVAAEIKARGDAGLGFACDATSRADVEAAIAATVKRFGRLDCLIHNATSRYSSHPTPLDTVPDEDWDDQVAVGLRASFHCAQAALPALRQAKGSLILLTSNAGMEGSVTLPVYSTVKGAQRALVKALAREWGPDGVRVNAVAPVAMTPAMEEFFERQPPMRAHIAGRAPMGRIGDPETDIGHAVNFLIGSDSAFVTGQTLVVNGGAFLL